MDEDQAKEFTSWNHVHIKTHKSNLHITIDWNVVFQMTSTKVDFAVKTRPCLISEARNFLKPSSSSTAVNPNGSKKLVFVGAKGHTATRLRSCKNQPTPTLSGGRTSICASLRHKGETVRLSWTCEREDLFRILLVK